MSLDQTAVQRVDTHVQVQRAEAEELYARASLWRAIRALVWVAVVLVVAPLLIAIGAAVTFVVRGAS